MALSYMYRILASRKACEQLAPTSDVTTNDITPCCHSIKHVVSNKDQWKKFKQGITASMQNDVISTEKS